MLTEQRPVRWYRADALNHRLIAVNALGSGRCYQISCQRSTSRSADLFSDVMAVPLFILLQTDGPFSSHADADAGILVMHRSTTR
jgi:hypothetical protein